MIIGEKKIFLFFVEKTQQKILSMCVCLNECSNFFFVFLFLPDNLFLKNFSAEFCREQSIDLAIIFGLATIVFYIILCFRPLNLNIRNDNNNAESKFLWLDATLQIIFVCIINIFDLFSFVYLFFFSLFVHRHYCYAYG